MSCRLNRVCGCQNNDEQPKVGKCRVVRELESCTKSSSRLQGSNGPVQKTLKAVKDEIELLYSELVFVKSDLVKDLCRT